jgi:hypothetical protein
MKTTRLRTPPSWGVAEVVDPSHIFKLKGLPFAVEIDKKAFHNYIGNK